MRKIVMRISNKIVMPHKIGPILFYVLWEKWKFIRNRSRKKVRSWRGKCVEGFRTLIFLDASVHSQAADFTFSLGISKVQI